MCVLHPRISFIIISVCVCRWVPAHLVFYKRKKNARAIQNIVRMPFKLRCPDFKSLRQNGIKIKNV